ncbi:MULTISPECIES: porin [Dickeya]|uniref:Outer membrane protein F n=1 Tax=Dickeya aquatica TaxID=1401087 RepID=A0A375AC91_9GAMM|nr:MULTISPECIES: porin [Dickeya]SLM63645.1 Outer membrane protein F precursor [Dickeya aquatica]
MMKRNILAVVIPALLAAGAANAAEVYNKDGNKLDLTGRVHAGYYFGDAAKSFQGKGDQTYARLGFKGETKINSELTGYGRFEYQFNASKAEDSNAGAGNSKTRYAYAGLKFSDFGSFDYGRNRGIAYDGISYTDVLPEWGGDQSYTDNITGRSAGVATYRNKNFFGLVQGWDFGLQYQAKHEDSTNVVKQTGDGFGISSSYTSPIGVGVIASYEAVDRTTSQVADGRGQKADAWAAGLKYDANNIYLATTYGEFHNLSYISSAAAADKTKVFEAVAQYHFDFGLTPSLAYVSAKADNDTSAVKTSGYITKYVSIGGTYNFNKNLAANVEYLVNLIDADSNPYGKKTGDSVFTGLTYQF